MSEQQQIYILLQGCLNSTQINTATAALVNIENSPTFLKSLLSIIFNQISDEKLLIMTLTTYKNFLIKRYNSPQLPLPQTTKQLVRSTLINLYYKINHSDVAINVYKQILYIVIAVSYPWNGLNIQDVATVEANIYFYRQIAKVYQYLQDENYRNIFENFVANFFPAIEKLVQQIMEAYSLKTGKLLKQIFRMFEMSLTLQLPQYLRQFDNFDKWILYLQTILKSQITTTDPKQNALFWSNKVLASRIISKFFKIYSSDNTDGKHFRGWSDQFRKRYCLNLLSISLNQFFSSNTTYINQQTLSNLLTIFYYTLKHSEMRNSILQVCEKILFEYLLPIIELKNPQIQLFTNDPIQFIRKQEDLTSNVLKRTAVDLIEILSVLNFNNKSFLMRFIQYASVTLNDNNASFQRKQCILYLIGKLKSKILQNKFIKKDFSKFLTIYFVPFLKDTNPILLSSVCELLSRFLVQISPSRQTIQQLVSLLYNCLFHNSLVIRYKAILAFTSLLGHEEAIELTKPHFSKILQIYVKILNEFDHENLLKSLQTIGQKFSKEIGQVGDQLIKHLVTMFYKYSLNKNNDSKQLEQQQQIQNTATAAISTIKRILEADLTQAMYFEVSGNIFEMLIFIIEQNLNYLDQMITLVSVLAYQSPKLVDYVFPYLMFRKMLEGVLYQTNLNCQQIKYVEITQKADQEFHEGILSTLKNLIKRMPTEILFSYPLPTHPQLLLCLIENKILPANQLMNLDTKEVNLIWGSILQSYSNLFYGVGNLVCDQQLIKSIPNGVSLYPWIQNINDINLLRVVLRKILSRIEQDDDQQQNQDSTTMQMLEKYAAEQEYVDDAQFKTGNYAYLYDAPYESEKDVDYMNQRLKILSQNITAEILNGLSSNQYSKYQKLIIQA